VLIVLIFYNLAFYSDPIIKSTLGIGSVVTEPHVGALPFVVKYLPLFPLCDGSTKATAAATSESVAISVAAEKRLAKLLALLIIPPIILDYRL